MLPTWRPMPLVRAPEAFDHPDWLFELKHDGFRALAVVERRRTRFLSRRGHEFEQWAQLEDEVAHTIRARRAVLDGEVVCLRPDGLSDFYALMFRREQPYFYAFAPAAAARAKAPAREDNSLRLRHAAPPPRPRARARPGPVPPGVRPRR